MENGLMEWIDGNVGSGLNMKYPACILEGDYAKGTTVSIAFAAKDQYQDTGAKMIHLGKYTTSNIISKSICRAGGVVNYRGLVSSSKNAKYAKSHVECDTLILDEISKSDTIPENIVKNNESFLEHEATVSKISEEQLFYLMSRGIKENDAVQMIIMGFNQGMQPIAGYNYGARLFPRVKEVTGLTMRWATGVATTGFLLCELVPAWIIRMFTTDAELIDISMYGLRVVFAVFPVVGFQMVASNFFLSIGMSKQAIFLSLTRQLIFLIPCLIVLPMWLGALGVWVSMPISDLVAAIVTAVLLVRQFKKFSNEKA